jgi:hypothetical protein
LLTQHRALLLFGPSSRRADNTHASATSLPDRSVPYSLDTTPSADAVQLALYRKMSASDRIRIGHQMSLDARAITLAAIRRRHPEYDVVSARWALFRLLVGDELFQKAWPNAPLMAP